MLCTMRQAYAENPSRTGIHPLANPNIRGTLPKPNRFQDMFVTESSLAHFGVLRPSQRSWQIGLWGLTSLLWRSLTPF